MSDDKKVKRPVGRPLFEEAVAEERIVTYVNKQEKKKLEKLITDKVYKDSNSKDIKSVSKLVRLAIQEFIKDK